MAEQSEYHYFLKELFPSAGPELLRLLQGAADNAHLLRSDFYTIRDWVEIAGYTEDETVHAILLLLLAALDEGSLCIEAAASALGRRLQDFVPEPEAIGPWTERIEEAIVANRYPALIGSSPTDDRPVILSLVKERRFLYFQRYLRAEVELHRQLQVRGCSGQQKRRAR